MLTADRAVSEKSWQANIIIIKKESSVLFLIKNDRIIPTMKHNYNNDDDFYKEDRGVSDSKS